MKENGEAYSEACLALMPEEVLDETKVCLDKIAERIKRLAFARQLPQMKQNWLYDGAISFNIINKDTGYESKHIEMIPMFQREFSDD
ncbi:MAG: hypothetical protein PUP93_27980 [Rhizonema sp. NSF051]|nr:hypothetical protein [Rhizonema sp. NSF051]